MLKFLKSNNPATAIFLFLIGLILKLPYLQYPSKPYTQAMDGFLYKLLIKKSEILFDKYQFLFAFVGYILIFTQAILLNKIANKLGLFEKTNYITAFCYLLITSLFKEWNIISASLIANSIIISIWAFIQSRDILSTFKSTVFNSALVVSIASMFYFPISITLILVIILFISTDKFRFKEILIFLSGLIIPYYFVFSWFWLTNQKNEFQKFKIALSIPKLTYEPWYNISIFFCIFFIIVSFIILNSNIIKTSIQIKKRWGIIYLFLIITAIIPFINATNSLTYWILTALPISLFAAYFFSITVKKKWNNYIFNTLLLYTLIFIGLLSLGKLS